MYFIMHKNDIIAKANDEQITDILNEDLCPACFFEGASLEKWVKSRSVDVHRSHSRQLYRVLRLNSDASFTDIIRVGHGISITDNWWIQEETENLDYNSLKKYNEEIANIAFFGSPANNDFIVSGYTELGTIGSYEKAWRYIDDSWYMLKQGNKAELISEYYAYAFLKSLGYSVAEYEVQRKDSKLGLTLEYIISKDYTENGKYDFEPFFNYFGENEDYDFIITGLNAINPASIRDYVEMCFYDALLLNVDRHNFNVGFLRDSNNGKIVCLAPWYDYNMSLASTKIPDFKKESPDLMKYFVQSEKCVEIIRDILPNYKTILESARYASVETIKAFPYDNFAYGLFEQYISECFTYFSDNFGIKKQIGR